MGCTPSQPGDQPIRLDDRPRPELRSNVTVASSISAPSEEDLKGQTKGQQEGRRQNQRENGVPNGVANGVVNGVDSSSPGKSGMKSIAFDVTLDNNQNKLNSVGVLPTKLQTKLAPLVNAPKLTADMLEERQKQVEANRQREIEKKKEVSRRSSRLRRNILQAKEFDKAQNQYKEIEDKQKSAGKNRDAKLAEIEKKKKIREERAQRARERAKRLKAQDGDIDFEIEKDDGFNEDDADSWLGDEDQPLDPDLGDRLYSGISTGTDRIYSGRGSPTKQFKQRTSAEVRERLSASTTDSFDYAFQRVPTAKIDPESVRDDFFDT